MNVWAGIRLVVAEIVAIAVNVIPLALWFYEDYSAETTMLIYVVESGASLIFAILCVLVISPSYDPDGKGPYKKRGKLIADFSMISFGFLGIITVFTCGFVFLVLKAEIDFQNVLYGFLLVIGFVVAEFVVSVLTLRPLPLRRAEFLLSKSMGKTALLFIGVFIGAFLSPFDKSWFVIPFIVLKTIADIGEPIQFFLGKESEDMSVLQP